MESNYVSAMTADLRRVAQLVERHALDVHFQPIVHIDTGQIHGFEALVRPPADCRWPTPDLLFEAARAEGVSTALEIECARIALTHWMAAGARGRLFVNMSGEGLLGAVGGGYFQRALELLRSSGASPRALVIELTEHDRVRDVDALRATLEPLRRHGVAIALDDFGDGRSSLRLWSELKPEFVKFDKYFTRGIDRHGDKVQTVRALVQIAETFGSQLVAEGVETPDELRTVRALGLHHAQGYCLGRPQLALADSIDAVARELLERREVSVLPSAQRASNNGMSAARLLREAPALQAAATHDEAYALFTRHPDLPSLAILDAQRPAGLIGRSHFITLYAQPFFKELFGRRPVLLHANTSPLVVDIHTGVEHLTAILTSSDQRYLTEGFVITEGGAYRGLGTGEELVRRVTEARIEAARHANPLTLLPGNIPITEHIERLLAGHVPFAAAYADLNHFKPFNDQYGYWRGDEMIRLLAQVIVGEADFRRDFVGDVGGDDFIVLFQSDDWQARCERIVERFDREAVKLYDERERLAGGIEAEDRYGVMRFHPCTTVSLGVVWVDGGTRVHAEDVANAAAAAKREAKSSRQGVWATRMRTAA
ncbi:MAG: EAL domain-containing protein [Rubrivivax sp.]|nr:EAL domain-containing protein [Rubrivivax sp.]